MAKAVKALILIAAVLAGQPVHAADPASGTEPESSGPARAEPDTTPPAPHGAQLFARHCAMCHKPADLARRLQAAIAPAAARVDMAAFLARHGRSDATADGAIIDYLASGTFR
jgi:mono/diheme cytochrome c family protein